MLCISNHPRYRGSAWKVSALDIEPSTISRFSVESHRSEYRTIHDFMVQRGRSCSVYRTIHDIVVQRGRSPLWITNHPRFHGSAWKVPALEAVTKRAERANGGTRAACFEQPEGVHSGCVDARPAKYTSSYSASTRPRMRLKSKCLFIPHHGDA